MVTWRAFQAQVEFRRAPAREAGQHAAAGHVPARELQAGGVPLAGGEQARRGAARAVAGDRRAQVVDGVAEGCDDAVGRGRHAQAMTWSTARPTSALSRLRHWPWVKTWPGRSSGPVWPVQDVSTPTGST
jgi:hypothetical protein